MTADGSDHDKTTGYTTGLAFLPKWQTQKNGLGMDICSTLAGELSQSSVSDAVLENRLKCITYQWCIFRSLTVNSVPWKEFNWLLQDLLETCWAFDTHNYWHALLTSTIFGYRHINLTSATERGQTPGFKGHAGFPGCKSNSRHIAMVKSNCNHGNWGKSIPPCFDQIQQFIGFFLPVALYHVLKELQWSHDVFILKRRNANRRKRNSMRDG